MKTPDTSPSTDNSTSLFDEVIQLASTPRVGCDRSERAARVLQSYTYITRSRLTDSSQDSSLSTPASQPSSKTIESNLSDYRLSSGTASWSSDFKSSLESNSGINSARSTVHSCDSVKSTRRRVPQGKDTLDAEALLPTIREIAGWFLRNVGMSGFKALLWIFFPLLIFSLFAASRNSGASAARLNCSYGVESRDPRCLRVCDSFTEDLTRWTSGAVDSNQSGSSRVTILEILSLGNSWQPAALITGILGASVILQLVVFAITSPLLDYGNYQYIVLVVGTGVGVGASALPITIFRPSLWWIVGILFLLATIGLGQASTWVDQYLSSLSKGIPVSKTRECDEPQIYQSERIRYVNRMSFAGITFGCLSSALCTLAAFFFLRSELVAETFGIDRHNWPLRLACCAGGLWWLFWNCISCSALLQYRTGPSLQSIPYPAGKHFPLAILGLGFGSFGNKGRSVSVLLLVCFLSSLGNATVFESGLICFSPRNFITLALLAQVFSLVGTVLFFVIQISLSKTSRLMLLITLLVHLLLPIYACVGFFFTASPVLTLNREWEFMVFAGAYGLCLGAHKSYIRTLLLACIPGTTVVGAYFSLLTLVNQLSTFVGTLEVLFFVYHNGDLRYTFVTMGAALLLAAILMVKYIPNRMPGDSEDVTESESLPAVSVISSVDENVYKASDSSPHSVGSVPVYIPKSLRQQYTSRALRQVSP